MRGNVGGVGGGPRLVFGRTSSASGSKTGELEALGMEDGRIEGTSLWKTVGRGGGGGGGGDRLGGIVFFGRTTGISY